MFRKKYTNGYDPIVSPVSPGERLNLPDGGVLPMNYSDGGVRRGRIYQCTDVILNFFQTIWDNFQDWRHGSNWDQPSWFSGRVLLIYLSGGMFAIGWWCFIDGLVYHNFKKYPIGIRFEDWLPGLGATIGLFMINMVSKGVLNADEYSYDGYGVAWKARIWFFISVVLLIASVGGSIGIMFIKYTNAGHTGEEAYFAYTIITQSVLVFVSAILLWGVRNYEERISL